MNRSYFILSLLVAVLALGAVTYAVYEYTQPPIIAPVATTTPPTDNLEINAYGEVTLGIGQTAYFEDPHIRPLRVVEDSRCPLDVQCIQAGTVRVEVQVVSGMGTSTSVIELGDTLTTEAEEITLTTVTPSPRSDITISDEQYRFTFDVQKRMAAVPTPAPGKCYVGGCSMQLCTDQPDAVSTCEYRESYACYQNATCERQASGACGWTETQSLRACLQAAQ